MDLQLKDEILLAGKYIVSLSAQYSDIDSDDPLFDRYAGKSSELMVEIRGGSNPYWQIDYTYLYEDKEDWKSIDFFKKNSEILFMYNIFCFFWNKHQMHKNGIQS